LEWLAVALMGLTLEFLILSFKLNPDFSLSIFDEVVTSSSVRGQVRRDFDVGESRELLVVIFALVRWLSTIPDEAQQSKRPVDRRSAIAFR